MALPSGDVGPGLTTTGLVGSKLCLLMRASDDQGKEGMFGAEAGI